MFEIFNETDENLDLDFLNGLLDYALKEEKVIDVSFNIIIVDNDMIHDINKEYRGIDRPTDVISFVLEDNKDNEDFVKKFGRILGDIYISIDKVKEQAKEYGHSEKRELAFLSVHGLLHLLGYDHMKREDEEVMFGRQDLILDGYGIKR